MNLSPLQEQQVLLTTESSPAHIILKFYFIFYVLMFCLCVICTTACLELEDSRGCFISLQTGGGANGCELLHGFWESTLDPLKKLQISEPALQLLPPPVVIMDTFLSTISLRLFSASSMHLYFCFCCCCFMLEEV